jgi:hypothetical protein
MPQSMSSQTGRLGLPSVRPGSGTALLLCGGPGSPSAKSYPEAFPRVEFSLRGPSERCEAEGPIMMKARIASNAATLMAVASIIENQLAVLVCLTMSLAPWAIR